MRAAARGPEVISTMALRTRSSDVFDAVDRGRTVLIRRYGRIYRLVFHAEVPRSERATATRRRYASSPVHQRGWSWTLDAKAGGLRLAKPRKRGRRRSR